MMLQIIESWLAPSVVAEPNVTGIIVFDAPLDQRIDLVRTFNVFPTEAMLRRDISLYGGFTRFEFDPPPPGEEQAFGLAYKKGSYRNPNVGKATEPFIPPVDWNSSRINAVGKLEVLQPDGTWKEFVGGGGDVEIVETETGKFSIRGTLANDPTRKVIYEQE